MSSPETHYDQDPLYWPDSIVGRYFITFENGDIQSKGRVTRRIGRRLVRVAFENLGFFISGKERRKYEIVSTDTMTDWQFFDSERERHNAIMEFCEARDKTTP